MTYNNSIIVFLKAKYHELGSHSHAIPDLVALIVSAIVTTNKEMNNCSVHCSFVGNPNQFRIAPQKNV